MQTKINKNSTQMPCQNHGNNNNACTTQHFSITQSNREERQGHKAKVIWLTGLSGAGKSTIANALELKLHTSNKNTYILDGDNIRRGLNKDLGFSSESRSENIRRISEVALMMMEAGLVVIVTCISPFRHDRENAKRLIGEENFVEVYISTPLNVCKQRDTKGLYEKSAAGKLFGMTGIDSPYEVPENPAIAINTSFTDVDTCAELIVDLIKSKDDK